MTLQWSTVVPLQALVVAVVFSGAVGVFLRTIRPIRPRTWIQLMRCGEGL
jgi:hypothetical protein